MDVAETTIKLQSQRQTLLVLAKILPSFQCSTLPTLRSSPAQEASTLSFNSVQYLYFNKQSLPEGQCN